MKTAALFIAVALMAMPSFARGRRSYSSPYYGGGHHTTSHGGSYGVGGSSHRGGRYTSPTGSHHYGRHK